MSRPEFSPEIAGDNFKQQLNIAVVARRIPVPIFTGINLVVHHLTARLARRHLVRVFVTDDDRSRSPEYALDLIAYGKSGYGDAGGVAAAGESYASALARYYGVPRRRTEWLEREVEAFRPDVVLAFGYDLAAYLPPLQKRWPVVFDPIDSEVLYLWRLLRSGKLQLTTAKHLVMSAALARTVMAKCNALITVSDEDSANLKRITGLRAVYTVPNGVDCDFFAPNPQVNSISGRIVFTGSLGWLPNAQALDWFLQHCWARVRRARPDASLEIVGKGMSSQQKEAYASYPGVQPTGFVDDIRSHVQAAEVSIAPMISGSGIKNKVLESWAMSRAVVVTTLAARGLQARDGEHMLVADTPDAFADAVLAVTSDAALRERLGAAGRALAFAQYSWESMAARVEYALYQATNRPRTH